MAIPKLTAEERHAMRLSLMDCPPKQIAAANQVAAFLAEDEDDVDNAFLVYTFHFSQPENEAELRDVMKQLGLAGF